MENKITLLVVTKIWSGCIGEDSPPRLALTSYTISLVEFYNFLMRVKKFIILNVLFACTVFELAKLPLVFLFSLLLGSHVEYATCADDEYIETAKREPNVKRKKQRTAAIDLLAINRVYQRNSLTPPFVYAVEPSTVMQRRSRQSQRKISLSFCQVRNDENGSGEAYVSNRPSGAGGRRSSSSSSSSRSGNYSSKCAECGCLRKREDGKNKIKEK